MVGKDKRLRCNLRANKSESPPGAKAGGQGQAEGVLGRRATAQVVQLCLCLVPAHSSKSENMSFISDENHSCFLVQPLLLTEPGG